MGMASTGFHESEARLQPRTMEHHRAIVSLMEELEAVDWYDQRIDATDDPELREILTHNRDEEKEHAAMTLEWLRRRDPELDRYLRMYLFTEGSIIGIEEAAEGGADTHAGNGAAASGGNGNGSSLAIGSLRRRSDR
ncbi:MAG TPA: ferritin-like domain-containing protein [Acidimicrobiia bacterium]|nr:ferritin-like domain-containing protein [Acidimicrobiia bacterium]